MIAIAFLYALAGAVGLTMSLVVTLQAMAQEDFDALKLRIARAAGYVAFEYGRVAGYQSGSDVGFRRGKEAAERAHTQFETEAKAGYWIGPKVEHEIFDAPLIPPPDLYYRPGQHWDPKAAIRVVRFRCGVKKLHLDGVVFTMPNWELCK